MVASNKSFEVAKAQNLGGAKLDLVTFFDCLHDMDDVVGAATYFRSTLKHDGTWMIIEPQAGDQLEGKLNPDRPFTLFRLEDRLHPDSPHKQLKWRLVRRPVQAAS